jgi:non-ribosomal peptide synthetase component E (peptide arylation enzyme)
MHSGNHRAQGNKETNMSQEIHRNKNSYPQPVDNAPKDQEDTPTSDIQSQAWMKKAGCRGATHKMFPREHKDITYINDARAICAECTVKEECLNYVMEFPMGDIHGVWAGMTPRQLATEQVRRRKKPSIPTLAQAWGDLY